MSPPPREHYRLHPASARKNIPRRRRRRRRYPNNLKTWQVFAPTNAAFLAAGVGPDNVDGIAPSILESLLKYHVLPGSVARESIAREDSLYTYAGINLATSGATLIDSEGTAVEIVEPDVAASNGRLHYVDGVLMPPDLMTSLSTYNGPNGSYEGVFDTLLEAIRLADMSDDFKGLNGPFTVSLGGAFFFFFLRFFLFRPFLFFCRGSFRPFRVDRFGCFLAYAFAPLLLLLLLTSF